VSQSRWRTNLGIFDDGSTSYNTYDDPAEAPILPVYGAVTSNIVLNFRGEGVTGYTSTNNLPHAVRLSRLNLNSTSTATNTITGGTLLFGENLDGSSSVLAPMIVQQNTGAFVINSNIITTNTTSHADGGWTGLTVTGTGSGRITLGGEISGNGGLTKSGGFTLELNGSAPNTYTGLTTVNGGVLVLNKTPGVNAFAGNAKIEAGGTLQLGANNQIPDGASIQLDGGTFSTGATVGFSDIVGEFGLTANSTIALGSGQHTLTFTGISGVPTNVLTVTGWTGNYAEFGTGGRLLFSDLPTNPNAEFSGFLATVHFQNYPVGATFLTTLDDGIYELAPVPEPATALTLATAALGFGVLVRRRLRRPVASTTEHRLAV
jgi:autotransporter-associated beta strand protein